MSVQTRARTAPGVPGAARFAPARRVPPPQRVCFRVDSDDLRRPSYWLASDRSPVSAARAADLVSSEVGAGLHAPLLDLDVPVDLGLDPEGRSVLWVQGLGERSWELTMAALCRAGLAGPLEELEAAVGGPVGSATARQRAAVLGSPGWEVCDPAALTATLRALGPTWDGPYADLVATATAALVTGTGRGVPTRSTSVLRDPWPVPLAVPAVLVASTRHHHLYLETHLEAATMFELLAALADADLLEEGYATATWIRGRAHLRMPWVHKDEQLLAGAA